MKKWHRLNLKIREEKIITDTITDLSKYIFFIDLAIIDLIIRPTVKRFKSQLDFWSFHRSMSSDDGHRLKFNFYTTTELAEEIFEEVILNKYFPFFRENYIELSTIKLTYINNEDIAGNVKLEWLADPKWPIEIQKSWPLYMKGACEMYLALMKEVKKGLGANPWKNKGDLERYYKKIDKEITTRWTYWAKHAFIHHLGMLFGYPKFILKVLINP